MAFQIDLLTCAVSACLRGTGHSMKFMWINADYSCSLPAGTVLYAHACALQEELLASHEAAEVRCVLLPHPAPRSSVRLACLKAQQRLAHNHGFKHRQLLLIILSLSACRPQAQGAGAAQLSAAQAAAEQSVRSTFAHAGQYIALACVLQPGKPVYADSLAAVQRLLPLPFLRSGERQGAGVGCLPSQHGVGSSYMGERRPHCCPPAVAGPLLTVHPKTADSPAEQWVRCWFGLDVLVSRVSCLSTPFKH